MPWTGLLCAVCLVCSVMADADHGEGLGRDNETQRNTSNHSEINSTSSSLFESSRTGNKTRQNVPKHSDRVASGGDDMDHSIGNSRVNKSQSLDGAGIVHGLAESPNRAGGAGRWKCAQDILQPDGSVKHVCQPEYDSNFRIVASYRLPQRPTESCGVGNCTCCIREELESQKASRSSAKESEEASSLVLKAPNSTSAKNATVGCCYSIGFGARMVPCCLKVENATEGDCLDVHGRRQVGGARGWHSQCPSSATEAFAWLGPSEASVQPNTSTTMVVVAGGSGVMKRIGAAHSDDEGCCFSIGFGAFMKPCCLKVANETKSLCLEAGSAGLVGGAVGWRSSCPSSAAEANDWIRADKRVEYAQPTTTMTGRLPWLPADESSATAQSTTTAMGALPWLRADKLAAASQSNCAAPVGIQHADNPSCREGIVIAEGLACTPQCAAGYVVQRSRSTPLSPRLKAPPAPILRCGNGVFVPSSFVCVPASGAVLASGSSTTTSAARSVSPGGGNFGDGQLVSLCGTLSFRVEGLGELQPELVDTAVRGALVEELNLIGFTYRLELRCEQSDGQLSLPSQCSHDAPPARRLRRLLARTAKATDAWQDWVVTYTATVPYKNAGAVVAASRELNQNPSDFIEPLRSRLASASNASSMGAVLPGQMELVDFSVLTFLPGKDVPILNNIRGLPDAHLASEAETGNYYMHFASMAAASCGICCLLVLICAGVSRGSKKNRYQHVGVSQDLEEEPPPFAACMCCGKLLFRF